MNTAVQPVEKLDLAAVLSDFAPDQLRGVEDLHHGDRFTSAAMTMTLVAAKGAAHELTAEAPQVAAAAIPAAARGIQSPSHGFAPKGPSKDFM